MEGMQTPQAQIGKLIVDHGRFFLESDGLLQELATGLLADKEQLEKAAGQDMELIYSEPLRFVVALKSIESKGPVQFILCYQGPAQFRQTDLVVQPELREQLAKQFLEAGVISEETYGQLTE